MALRNLGHGGTADADLQKDLELLFLAPPTAPLDTQNFAQHGRSPIRHVANDVVMHVS